MIYPSADDAVTSSSVTSGLVGVLRIYGDYTHVQQAIRNERSHILPAGIFVTVILTVIKFLKNKDVSVLSLGCAMLFLYRIYKLRQFTENICQIMEQSMRNESATGSGTASDFVSDLIAEESLHDFILDNMECLFLFLAPAAVEEITDMS